MFIFVAVAMASCGDDDKDEPDSPNGNDSAKIYTLELAPGERAELKLPLVLICIFTLNRIDISKVSL